MSQLNEHEKLQNESVPLKEQPKTPVPLINEMLTFSILDLIRRWQPTGFRVVLNLPLVGDDNNCLFFINPHPYVPYFGDLNKDFDVAIFNRFKPVLTGDTLGSYFHPNVESPTITISQHSPPPILSSLALSYRYWRGAIKFRIRSISSFTTQGYGMYTPYFRVKHLFGKVPLFSGRNLIRLPDITYNDPMINSYAPIDLSQTRHAEIEIPYMYTNPYRDTYDEMDKVIRVAKGDNNIEILEHSNLIGVNLRGIISGQGDTKQAMFEVEYCAGDDLEFSGESTLPADIFESKSTFFRRDPNMQVYTPLIYPSRNTDDGVSSRSFKRPTV